MWDNPRQLNLIAGTLLGLSLVLAGCGAGAWLVRQPLFAIRTVIVQGPLHRANAAYIESVVRHELRGTFFTMSLERGRVALQRVPWIRQVALRRLWPARLEIVVAEHEPLARWNDAGLVSTLGEVFSADYDGELPLFTGPEGSAPEMTARYAEFSQALAPLQLSVQELYRSSRAAWRVKADSGLVLELGRNEPAERLARFIPLYEKTVAALARHGTRVESVDLRYRNGFAARVPSFRDKAPRKHV